MRSRGLRHLLAPVVGLYFIGSAIIAHAQEAELPFAPVLTVGSTNLVNDQVFANLDGSFTLLGQQQGGSVNGQPVWDLSWNMTLNQDPSIFGTLTLTNLTTTTRNFNLAFTLPITPAFAPSLFGGSLSATLVDANGDLSASLTPIGLNPSIYRGNIDGVTALSLFEASLTCTGSGPGCAASGVDDFGLPGPSIAGPAVNTTISILLGFTLSPGDRVNLNTAFVVEPPSAVPAPAALPLLLSGLGALALRRRRRFQPGV